MLEQEQKIFDETKRVYDGAILKFEGYEGLDVYNCCVPFTFEGKQYIFGRVETRGDYANSITVLYEMTSPNVYTPVKNAMTYPLEDPFIQLINGEFVLGGTHVRKTKGKIDEYRVYFYRGKDPRWLTHFTCGPRMMKDVRLVELENGDVGVFSRQNKREIAEKYNTLAVIGFARIKSLDELDENVIENAVPIEHLFGPGEWGGANQCYLLKDGRVGIVAHRAYSRPQGDVTLLVYLNVSFIFDPDDRTVSDMKIIGDKKAFPDCEYKLPKLEDCAFTTGIVLRKDGKADLYSGLGDVHEGRITIDNPFEGLLDKTIL